MRKVDRLMGVAAWLLIDGALDTVAPLVGLGAAAGIDRGYVNAINRAIVTVGKVGLLILAIPYDMATKGGIFLDNQFLKYGLATFGDVVSNLTRDPGDSGRAHLRVPAGQDSRKILVVLSETIGEATRSDLARIAALVIFHASIRRARRLEIPPELLKAACTVA